MIKRYTSRKLTAKAMREAYDEAIREYNSHIQQDRIQAVKSGATSIPSKGFTNKEIEQAANMALYSIKQKALDTIAEQREAVKDRLTEAPSYEAAAYAVAIAGRDDMTKEEISAGLERFGDHNTQKAILSAAKRSGHADYYGGKTEVENYSEDLGLLVASVNRFLSPPNISESASDEGRQILERGILGSIEQPRQDAFTAFADIITGASTRE